MRITHHERSPKPETMELRHDPLVIWLTRNEQLIVQIGDRLGKVATRIREHWQHLSDIEARKLVALWFAMGERRGGYRATNAPWSLEEKDASPDRRYCRVTQLTE